MDSREEVSQCSTLFLGGGDRGGGWVGWGVVGCIQLRGGGGGFGEGCKRSADVCRELLKSGIWLRPLGDVIPVLPPLVFNDFSTLMNGLRQALEGVG